MSLRLAQLHLYVDIHRHDLYVAPVLAIVVAGLISTWVAREAAERLHQTVESLSIPLQGDIVRPTVSIGIALADQPGTALSRLLHDADLAMYAAKTQGRNRVVCAENPTPGGHCEPIPAASPV